jgi:hypothetical protein
LELIFKHPIVEREVYMAVNNVTAELEIASKIFVTISNSICNGARTDYIWRSMPHNLVWNTFMRILKKYFRPTRRGSNYWVVKDEKVSVLSTYIQEAIKNPPESAPKKETWCQPTFVAKFSEAWDAAHDRDPD